MECKQHPEYWVNCKMCLYVWDFKQYAQRFFDGVDRQWEERLISEDYGTTDNLQ